MRAATTRYPPCTGVFRGQLRTREYSRICGLPARKRRLGILPGPVLPLHPSPTGSNHSSSVSTVTPNSRASNSVQPPAFLVQKNTGDLQGKMRANYNASHCDDGRKAAGAGTMENRERTGRRTMERRTSGRVLAHAWSYRHPTKLSPAAERRRAYTSKTRISAVAHSSAERTSIKKRSRYSRRAVKETCSTRAYAIALSRKRGSGRRRPGLPLPHQLEPLVLGQHRDPGLARLVQLRSGAGPGHHVVRLLRHRARHLGAEPLGGGLGLVARHLLQ